MLKQTRPYLNHLYSLERIELATMILQKESRKLLLSVDDLAWQNIDTSIREWAKCPTKYHLEDDGPRDFWDSFAAFMEGIKLKPSFTVWLTAENVSWTKMTLPIRQIQMTSPLAQLKKVPGLDVRVDLTFAELIDVFTKNPTVITEQKRLIDDHSTDPRQDTYPIIVREAGDGLFKIMDGNRRTLKATINGRDTIEAWVGHIDGNRPINFWIPINDMFQLLKVYKDAVDCDDDDLQASVVQVLKSRFKMSEMARQAYIHRIGNQTDIGKRLYELTQQDLV